MSSGKFRVLREGKLAECSHLIAGRQTLAQQLKELHEKTIPSGR